MRKLILALNVTPDGFCNHADVVIGEDWMRYVNDLTEQMDTAVFGRVTYQLFEDFWPVAAKERTGSAEMIRFAGIIDRMEKVVFSRTLQQSEWNNTRIHPALNKEAVEELKGRQGKDIIVFGGPGLVSELIALDAFDECYIGIQPMLSGTGHRLFSDDIQRDKVALELIDTNVFNTGVVLLHYRRNKA